MSLFKNVTVAVGATDVITAAEAQSAPLELQNRSDKVITLTATGSTGDTYDMDPWEILRDVPGNGPITATVPAGTALLVVLRAGINSGEKVLGESSSDPIFTSPGGPGGAGGAAAGPGVWSVGQEDFTAAYLAATTLTLGAFPAAMGSVDDEKFFMVVVTPLAGAQVVYISTVNKMSLAGAVLTVEDAAFAVDDIAYDVLAWGPPKGYDASVDGHDATVLNPGWTRLQNPTVVDVTDQGDSTETYFIAYTGYKFGLFQLSLDCDAGTVTATVEASAEPGVADSAAEYQDVTNDLFGVASLVSTAAPASDMWWIKEPLPVRFLKLKIVYASGDTSADAKVFFYGIY